jgi:hypothetical protein
MLAALLILAATVQGTVVIDDNEPLPGCVIRLGARAETITDAGGRYTFSDVPPGRYDVDFELLGFKGVRQHVTVGPRDVILPPQPLEIAPTNCAITIKWCRDTPPVSPWDDPLCADVEEHNALRDRGDFASLRTRHLTTTSIPERVRLAGMLLRRVSGDGDLWNEVAGYADLAVLHPAVDGQPSRSFVRWSEQRNADPFIAWRVVESALMWAGQDPRSRPMLMKALESRDAYTVYFAIHGFATQQDEAALPAIARALQRFPDRTLFTTALAPFRSPEARALARP